MKTYILSLGIYEDNNRIESYALTKGDKKFEVLLEFPNYYTAKKLGKYDELIKTRKALIEMETIENGKLINLEPVEADRN